MHTVRIYADIFHLTDIVKCLMYVHDLLWQFACYNIIIYVKLVYYTTE